MEKIKCEGEFQVTSKMKIYKPANEVYDAIVDPVTIGKFWFSSSSEVWKAGSSVTLNYDEYNAEVTIKVLEVEEDRKIVFSWGEESNEKNSCYHYTERVG